MNSRLVMMLLASGLASPAWSASMRWEAEDLVVNPEAYRTDSRAVDHWNLWSTDQDAATKWSGGVVLQSPLVKADRSDPAAGAPPLHLRVEDLADGEYGLSMKIGRVLGFSLDGQTWQRGAGEWTVPVTVHHGRLDFWIDDLFAMEEESARGAGYLDWVRLVKMPEGHPVDGWATQRIPEQLDRGLVAIPCRDGVYLSWRHLQGDPPDAAFTLYRLVDGERTPLHEAPLRDTTDFMDERIDPRGVRYEVVPHGFQGATGVTAPLDYEGPTAYRRLPLRDTEATVHRAGIADLDGDGDYDFVLKTPNRNIDPWVKYWKPSPGTYRVSAYLEDGTFLWENDLGWAIEQGAWYSPMVACDLNGDGRAEVAVKTGEGDPRDAEGRVSEGVEWLTVWDGMTGREIARVSWPSRDGFRDYNRSSRNQLAVAYLDGRTPCLVALRGTYNLMKAEAYQLTGGTLNPLWKYDSSIYGRDHQGQGAHFTLAHDVDADGRDELLLGSVMLDDDGLPLWTTGKGHPDAAYLADIDPARPGLEIAYVMESRQTRGGLCLADAASGKLWWELDEPTRHVHGKGLCADIDPDHPGFEIYGQDADGHEQTGHCWLFAADGTLLEKGDVRSWGFSQPTAYWDADLQKELAGRSIRKADGTILTEPFPARCLLQADLVGDWREEVLVSLPGELRLYLTTIPARDRRTCLMQDPLYRSGVMMNAMGYPQDATLSYSLQAPLASP